MQRLSKEWASPPAFLPSLYSPLLFVRSTINGKGWGRQIDIEGREGATQKTLASTHFTPKQQKLVMRRIFGVRPERGKLRILSFFASFSGDGVCSVASRLKRGERDIGQRIQLRLGETGFLFPRNLRPSPVEKRGRDYRRLHFNLFLFAILCCCRRRKTNERTEGEGGERTKANGNIASGRQKMASHIAARFLPFFLAPLSQSRREDGGEDWRRARSLSKLLRCERFTCSAVCPMIALSFTALRLCSALSAFPCENITSALSHVRCSSINF